MRLPTSICLISRLRFCNTQSADEIADLNLSHQQWKSFLESVADIDGVKDLYLLGIGSLDKQRADVWEMLNRDAV